MHKIVHEDDHQRIIRHDLNTADEVYPTQFPGKGVGPIIIEEILGVLGILDAHLANVPLHLEGTEVHKAILCFARRHKRIVGAIISGILTELEIEGQNLAEELARVLADKDLTEADKADLTVHEARVREVRENRVRALRLVQEFLDSLTSIP